MKASAEAVYSFHEIHEDDIVKAFVMLRKKTKINVINKHIRSVHQQASSHENISMSRSMWCSSVNSAFVVEVLHQVVAYTRLQDSGNASCCIAHAAMQVSKQLKTHSTAHDREGAGPNHKEKLKKGKKKKIILFVVSMRILRNTTQHSRCKNDD